VYRAAVATACTTLSRETHVDNKAAIQPRNASCRLAPVVCGLPLWPILIGFAPTL